MKSKIALVLITLIPSQLAFAADREIVHSANIGTYANMLLGVDAAVLRDHS